jgi:hypothetical protein
MKIIDENQEVEVRDIHWALVVDLFTKWGHEVKNNEIKVVDVRDITDELSAWGIPWRHV